MNDDYEDSAQEPQETFLPEEREWQEEEKLAEGDAEPDADGGLLSDLQRRFEESTEGTISVEIRSESISGETIKAAGILIEQLNVLSDNSSPVAVKLTAQHFRVWAPEELARCEGELIFESSEIEALSRVLEEKRLLILSGDPETGKGSTALLAASVLIRRLQLKGALFCQGLDATVSVDLEEISSADSFRRQVILLEDALAGENPDLMRLFKTLETVRYGALSQGLRKSGSAILITAASHTIDPWEARLQGLGVLHRVGSPSIDLQRVALRRFAERLTVTAALREIVESFLDANGDHLSVQLGAIPKIARFVQEYLGEVAEGRLTVRQALDRTEDLSEWLLNDLAGDLDAQAAVLSIVLGSAVPPASGVPLLVFDRIRRRILDVLRSELRIPDDQPSPRELGRELFLDRARARVVDMPAPLPDLVRFKDDRYPRRLWQALLGRGRGFATLLLPLLQDLTADADPFIQACAARALGRIGQIDPLSQAMPRLRAWVLGPKPKEDLAAAFLQGAVASSDGVYRDFCLGTLRHLASQETTDSAVAAIRALRMIGRPDPALPVEELRRIALHRLPVRVELLRQVEQEVSRLETEIRSRQNPRRVTAELRVLHLECQTIMAPALVSSERLPLLGAFQYSLAGVLLAQGGDPGPVLEILIPWMKREPERLAPLIAYAFFHRKGLIDLMDRHKWISSAFGMEPCSRFLIAASRGPEEAAVLCGLLERGFQAFSVFPGLFRYVLEQRFLQILRSWSQEGCRVISLRPTVVGLLSSLLASEDLYLRRTMTAFLRTDAHFVVRGSRLRALATDALSGKGREPLPEIVARPRRLPAWMAKREENPA